MMRMTLLRMAFIMMMMVMVVVADTATTTTTSTTTTLTTKFVEYTSACWDATTTAIHRCAFHPLDCHDGEEFITGHDLYQLRLDEMEHHMAQTSIVTPCTPHNTPVGRCRNSNNDNSNSAKSLVENDRMELNQAECSFGPDHCLMPQQSFVSVHDTRFCTMDREEFTNNPTQYGACRNVATGQLVCSLHPDDCIVPDEEWMPLSPFCECHGVHVGYCHPSPPTNGEGPYCAINAENCAPGHKWTSPLQHRLNNHQAPQLDDNADGAIDCRLCPPKRHRTKKDEDDSTRTPLPRSNNNTNNNNNQDSRVLLPVFLTLFVLLLLGSIFLIYKSIAIQRGRKNNQSARNETITFSEIHVLAGGNDDAEFVDLSLTPKGDKMDATNLKEASEIVQHQKQAIEALRQHNLTGDGTFVIS